MFKNLLRKIQIYLEEIKGPRDVHVSILSERKLTCYITDISTGEESMVEISCKTICHDWCWPRFFCFTGCCAACFMNRCADEDVCDCCGCVMATRIRSMM